ncbi:hypothetical protein ACIGXI_26250 [Kitasatospora aureofaciens]|uniref:hypothetical protein n=1 Tax=Kitasatospora aureofaciens TaxID=1894 RepID=UPI0037CADC1B
MSGSHPQPPERGAVAGNTFEGPAAAQTGPGGTQINHFHPPPLTKRQRRTVVALSIAGAVAVLAGTVLAVRLAGTGSGTQDGNPNAAIPGRAPGTSATQFASAPSFSSLVATPAQSDLPASPSEPRASTTTVTQPPPTAAANPAPGHLYAVAADRQRVRAWSGTGSTWTDIGPAAQDLIAGPAGLFLTDPATGDISHYDGTPGHWTKIGSKGRQFAVAGNRLYAIKEDGAAVMRWDGSPGQWTSIGSSATKLYAGGAGLFATDPATGGINHYNGTGTTPAAWTPVGGPGADFAVDNTHLYGLSTDHTQIHQWTGTADQWQPIGGSATKLYAGGAGLFITDLTTGQILKYNGTPMNWTPIGETGSDLVVDDQTVYRLSADHQTITRWTGHGTEWTTIDTPAAALTATG